MFTERIRLCYKENIQSKEAKTHSMKVSKSKVSNSNSKYFIQHKHECLYISMVTNQNRLSPF